MFRDERLRPLNELAFLQQRVNRMPMLRRLPSPHLVVSRSSVRAIGTA